MLLKVVEPAPAGEAGGKAVFRDIYIDEGEMFLLPRECLFHPLSQHHYTQSLLRLLHFSRQFLAKRFEFCVYWLWWQWWPI